MSSFLFLVVGVFALGYYFVKKRYSYWTDRGFASPPSVFPFGSLKGVGTKITSVEAMQIFYKKYKGKVPAIGTYFFLNPVIMPIDPELIKNILVREFSSFTDRTFYLNKEDDPAWANLLTMEGQEWRERRVKLTPIFTSGKMKMMFDIVDTISDRLVDTVKIGSAKTSSVEMRDLVARYTADNIGNCAFGLECKCLEDPNSKFLKQGRRIFDLTPFELMKFFIISGYPDLSRKLHLRVSPTDPTDFFMRTFLETLEYREKNNIKRNDFVSLLLGLKDSLTPKELAAESFLTFTAGFETSSTLMTFTLYELAMNPDIQSKLREEIEENVGENDGKVTYEMIFGMKFLDMVINETLRKFPPIPNLDRKCTKEYQIPGTNLIIPKGTIIDIPTYSLHHDPEYFPEPENFDPERFSPENVKARTPYTFMPFGEGPRNCIGLRFGLMQAKLGIVKLLQNFEFSPCEKTLIPMKFAPASPFLSPVGGMFLTLKKIE